MNTSTSGKVFQLLMYGMILAVAKLVYLFFDTYNIFDFVIFVAAGIMLGGKVPSKQRLIGLLLCLPAFTLCLFFVINLGYKSIVNGIGTSYAISLIVIPVATIIGLFINTKLALRKSIENK
jgi:hypothetical protein